MSGWKRMIRAVVCVMLLFLGNYLPLYSEPIVSTAIRLQYVSEQHHAMGADTARRQYRGMGIFATGFATGVLLLAATVYSGLAAGGDTRGFFTGIGIFGLTLWAGSGVADMFPLPEPGNYMPDLAENERTSFDRGFKEQVDRIRFENYLFGTILGVAVEIAVVSWLMGVFFTRESW